MRAQTTLDFAIGISIFLLVVVYVLAFVPGMLDPFVASQEENSIVADRAADQLSQGTLGSSDRPFILSTQCTVTFFKSNASSSCAFDPTVSVKERLGLVGNPPGTGANIQVEMRGNVSLADADGADTLCWDGGDGKLVEVDDSDCDDSNDTVFTIGGDPPSNNEGVVVSRRVVSLEDETVTLYVRVW